MLLKTSQSFETDNESIAENEAEIIKKAAEGDAESFAELVRQYERLVYNLAFQEIRDADDAFDVSQEVFLKAYRSLTGFRGECKFSTWIYRIAKNAIKDHMRSRARRRTVSLTEFGNDDDGESKTADIVDTSLSARPQDAAEQNELRDIVRAAIDTLSEDHRQIIVLRDIEGYSYEAIAEILGVELGTVKSRLNRARNSIKEFLIKRNIF